MGQYGRLIAYSIWLIAYGLAPSIRPSRRMRLLDWTGQYRANAVSEPYAIKRSEPYAACQQLKAKSWVPLYAQQHTGVIHDHAPELTHTDAFLEQPLNEGGEPLNWGRVEHLAKVSGEGAVFGADRQDLGGNLGDGQRLTVQGSTDNKAVFDDRAETHQVVLQVGRQSKKLQ